MRSSSIRASRNSVRSLMARVLESDLHRDVRALTPLDVLSARLADHVGQVDAPLLRLTLQRLAKVGGEAHDGVRRLGLVRHARILPVALLICHAPILTGAMHPAQYGTSADVSGSDLHTLRCRAPSPNPDQ